MTILFLTTTAFSYSQEYNFKPKWNKGETKQIRISESEREFKDDVLISDTIFYNEAKITVLKDNKKSYTLEILLENQALLVVKSFYDNLGEELNEYKNLKLIYSVSKETGESELLNWEEAQKFMIKSIDQISKIVKEKNPEETNLLGFIIMPIQESFKNKENIEGFMDSNIGYILTPFNKNFTVGKTITNSQSEENPFNPMENLSSTTSLTLVSVNEESKTCLIEQEIKIDFSQYIKMVKSMMHKMAESIGVNDSITAAKNKEIDEFEIDTENLQTISYDYETTWVNTVVNTIVIKGTDPREGLRTKKEILRTISIH